MMDILTSFMALILGFIGVVILLQIVAFYLVIRFIKTRPTLALFLLIVLIAIGIAETLSVVAVTQGVITLVGTMIILKTQYKRLKKGLGWKK